MALKWLKEKWERYAGHSALSRVEGLIAAKRDEISRAKRLQLDEVQSIQKQIDDVATEIVGLRKKKERLEAKCEGVAAVNLQRLKQMEAELDELLEMERSLTKPGTISTPAGSVMQFTTLERNDDD